MKLLTFLLGIRLFEFYQWNGHLLLAGIILGYLVAFLLVGIQYHSAHFLTDKSCPKCHHKLRRVPRLYVDLFFHHLTFRLFQLRRYHCPRCFWTGLLSKKK